MSCHTRVDAKYAHCPKCHAEALRVQEQAERRQFHEKWSALAQEMTLPSRAQRRKGRLVYAGASRRLAAVAIGSIVCMVAVVGVFVWDPNVSDWPEVYQILLPIFVFMAFWLGLFLMFAANAIKPDREEHREVYRGTLPYPYEARNMPLESQLKLLQLDTRERVKQEA